MHDGSGIQTRWSTVSDLLASIKQSQSGLDINSLELLVRAIWQVTDESKDIEFVDEIMKSHLAIFGGFGIIVKSSKIMFGAIDVECRFCSGGEQVTHTTHLW